MQTTSTLHAIYHPTIQEQLRHRRIERRFSTARQSSELVRDLLRAHCIE